MTNPLSEVVADALPAWDAVGGALWLDREQWGIVVDALIDHRDAAEQRKRANSASNSDVRADMCATMIGLIGDAAKTIAATTPAASEGVDERARELLAREYERNGNTFTALALRKIEGHELPYKTDTAFATEVALRAIAAALRSPAALEKKS